MNNISKARELARLSQKQMALTLGVSPPTVSEWESGKKTPTAKNLLQLSELLSCSVDFLLGLTGDPTPPGAKKEPPALRDVLEGQGINDEEFLDKLQYIVDLKKKAENNAEIASELEGFGLTGNSRA